MSKNMPLSAWVSNDRESTKVDKIWTYLDQLFDSNHEPNGMFLYDWGNPLTENNGAYKFSQVAWSVGYKSFADREIDLYSSEECQKFIRYRMEEKNVRNIIDIGCGDGKKSAKLLYNTLGKELQWKTYIPTDISPYFVDHAASEVQSTLHAHHISVKTAGMNADILSTDAFKDIKQKIYFFLGGSIGNFSDAEIIQIYKNMASDSAFGDKENIVITYFTAPDKTSETYADDVQQMLAAYGDPNVNNPYYNKETHDTTKQWIMSGFEALGIDSRKLDFFVTYDEKNMRVLSWAKVKEQILITHGGKNYIKQPGEFLWAIQSRRFTIEKMKSLAETAGAHMWNPTEDQGIAMAILESSRSAEGKAKRKKTLKNTLISTAVAAWLAGAIGTGMKLGEKEYRLKKKQESESITLKKWRDAEIGAPFFYKDNPDSTDILKARDESIKYILDNMVERYEVSEEKIDELKSFLTDVMENENEVFMFFNASISLQGYFGDIDPRDEFVDKIVQKYPRLMKEFGIAPLPYQRYMLHKQAMINTVLTTDNAIDSAEEDNIKAMQQAARGGVAVSMTTSLGVVDMPFAMEHAELVRKTVNGKSYIVAKRTYQENAPYSIALGREICIRILMQSSGSVRSFLETYYHYYPDAKYQGFYVKDDLLQEFIQYVSAKHSAFPDNVSKQEIHEFLQTHPRSEPWYKWMWRYNDIDTAKNYLPDLTDLQRNGWELDPDRYFEWHLYEMKDGTVYKIADTDYKGKKYLVAKKITKYHDINQMFTTENANLVLEDYRKLMQQTTKKK